MANHQWIKGVSGVALAAALAPAAQAQQHPSLAEAVVTDEAEAFELDVSATASVSYATEGQPTGSLTPRGLDPHYGNINPFYGNIGAFWGDINPFYGNINPFYGNIGAFYGNINPFYGDIVAFWGNINPFYKDIIAFDSERLNEIGTFWNDVGGTWADLDARWAQLDGAAPGSLTVAQQQQLDALARDLDALVSTFETMWGNAVQAQTNKSFRDGFAKELFARHGIDPDDPNALLNLDAEARARLFMDWHDSVMTFAGIDHVDHWMAAVGWTPSLTQIQGSGADSVIGIIDGNVGMNDEDLLDNLLKEGGKSGDVDGHGAAVASLIYAAHDGKGTMGIAPNATVIAYNPFDEDGTADWSDLRDGILMMKDGGSWLFPKPVASIINLSLGEEGYAFAPGFADLFSDPDIAKHRDETLFVMAAGNEGTAQTENIEWDFATDTVFILVGSISPKGEISSFSNTPGTACLLDNGVCDAGNELYMRTVVAPGEMLLVSDGNGGLKRVSGTSFAAPLVSGAIALLQDRWEWLADHPDETAEIIFRSARDLGEEGPDPVYGWGLLDVTASQAPLDFNDATFYTFKRQGRHYRYSRTSAASLVNSGIPSWWETSDVFFYVIEPIGDTHRDFSIPMSSTLYGKQTNVSGSWQYLQDYVASRFGEWINSGGKDRNGDGRAGFSPLSSNQVVLANGWTMQFDSARPRLDHAGYLRPTHTAASVADASGRLQVTMGIGNGASALANGNFDLFSDHDRHGGGVNPVLGYASGDSFASAHYAIGEGTTVSLGYTENRLELEEIDGLSERERFLLEGLDEHRASAMSASIDQRLSAHGGIAVQYTRLAEKEAFFGVQSTAEGLMGEGSITEALTLSADQQLGNGFAIDVSLTASRSMMAEEGSLTMQDGLWSSAGQLALSKQSLFGKHDKMRLSLGQPLTIEGGTFQYRSLGVVDRTTGELGEFVQDIDLRAQRRLFGEALYAAPLGETATLDLFGRVETAEAAGRARDVMVGGNVRFDF